MPGKIEWTATYVDHGGIPNAEIYTTGGDVVLSQHLPCKPPTNCPLSMDNVQFGNYRAALAVSGNRYYYVAGASAISIPNDVAGATVISLTEATTPISITINVQPG